MTASTGEDLVEQLLADLPAGPLEAPTARVLDPSDQVELVDEGPSVSQPVPDHADPGSAGTGHVGQGRTLGALWVTGDTLEVVRLMPSASVDLIITSPPFLALRSYLPADDPAKVHEIGQESTPGEFLDVLLDLVVEWRRILTPHGSLCVELGDTYSGSGGAGGDYTDGGLRDGQAAFSGSAAKRARNGVGENDRPARNGRRNRPADVAAGILAPTKRPGPKDRDSIPGWPLDKSLCMIPQLFAIALSYGRNPLTGRTIEPWRVRNVVRWCRPNPPVGALGDKFRPATSEMIVACTGGKRWFDLDAVRSEPIHGYTSTRGEHTHREIAGQPQRKTNPLNDDGERIDCNPNGAPPLDYWVIPTHPYKGSHYATFPPALIVKPIEAMCPRKVCLECGEPSVRVVDRTNATGVGFRMNRQPGNERDGGPTTNAPRAAEVTTLGWSCCGHGDGCMPTLWRTAMAEVEQGKGPDGKWYDLDEWDLEVEPTATRTKRKRKRVLDTVGACAGNHWRPGLVLDPFGGSGTTLAVATGHGRDGIGIDLDQRNVDLARQRVGPMFFHEVTALELAEQLVPDV